MANRIIKDSICTSETIDEMSWFEECFYYRLWTHCDDFGRMDARPKVLKAKLFPLKDRLSLKEVESALSRLADIGCVVLYVCDGKPLLYIPSWGEHQRVRNSREKYPSPDNADSPQVAATCGDLRPHARVFENPIQSESESESNPNPREGVSSQAPRTDFDAFILAYNELCPELPAAQLLTEKRKTAIRAFSKQLSLAQFREACEKANNSPFCAGGNDRGWKADFDFLIRPDKAASVLEGKYDKREGSDGRAGTASNTGASSGKSGTDWGIEPDISV